MTDTHSQLKAAIEARFVYHVQDTDIPPDSIPDWTNVLTQFIDDAMAKFANGQREHGGDLRTRNGRREMRPEIIDLIFYHLADDITKPHDPSIDV